MYMYEYTHVPMNVEARDYCQVLFSVTLHLIYCDMLSYFNSGLTYLTNLVHKHTPEIPCLCLSKVRITGSLP